MGDNKSIHVHSSTPIPKEWQKFLGPWLNKSFVSHYQWIQKVTCSYSLLSYECLLFLPPPASALGAAVQAKTQSVQYYRTYLVSWYSHPITDRQLGPEWLILNATSAGELQSKRRSGGHTHITSICPSVGGAPLTQYLR